MSPETIVAFSSVRWNDIAHRTQHLLSRLAVKRRVLFVEEPVARLETGAHWQFSSPAANVLVCQPHVPRGLPLYGPEQLAVLQPLMHRLKLAQIIHAPIAWLATPLALPLLNELEPCLIIYDCIDDLNIARGLSPAWQAYETSLLDRADVVFASGFGLYQDLHERHPNVTCIPSSVDAAHFRREPQRAPNGHNGHKGYNGHNGHSTRPRIQEPEPQARLPHPRLGYCGVLDKRVDFELLDLIARTRPEWQIVLVGPVVDLNPKRLPRHANLHYFGPRPYDELPGYLAGWDVALLPLVVGETTRHLNPASVLEYMAAERMIVSTRIPDVVEPYCEIVYVGHSPNTFIIGCEEALHPAPADRDDRAQWMREVLSHTSWQATARTVDGIIARALEQRRAAAVFTLPAYTPARFRGEWVSVS